MDAVMGLAGRHGLRVIEDAAQACGASLRGRHVGSFGDVGMFSFQINEMIRPARAGWSRPTT